MITHHVDVIYTPNDEKHTYVCIWPFCLMANILIELKFTAQTTIIKTEDKKENTLFSFEAYYTFETLSELLLLLVWLIPLRDDFNVCWKRGWGKHSWILAHAQ